MRYSVIIYEYLKSIFEIEWGRANMYPIEDIYHRLPSILFRFKGDDDKKYLKELKEVVESFQGKQKWTIYSTREVIKNRNNNFVLCLYEEYKWEIKMRDLNKPYQHPKEAFGDKYYQLCDEAIEDIPFLASHIRNYYEKKGMFDNEKFLEYEKYHYDI